MSKGFCFFLQKEALPCFGLRAGRQKSRSAAMALL
jgi:hypothetical protein